MEPREQSPISHGRDFSFSPTPYCEKILDRRECSTIAEIILQYEKSVKASGPDLYPRTADDSLTGRFWCYNWLSKHPTINKILLPKLKTSIKNAWSPYTPFFPMRIQLWANTFRKNEGIGTHSHHPLVISANIFICGDPKIGTVYVIDGKEHHDTNQEGEIVIFSGTIPHYVNPNPTDDIRITIAMDIQLAIPPNAEDQEKANYYMIE